MTRTCQYVLLAFFATSLLEVAAPAADKTSKSLAPAAKAACDFAYSIAAGTPGVSIRRRTGNFNDETLARPVFGCGLIVAGSFAKAGETADAAQRLREAFERERWTEMPPYGADGTDGTSFAFRNGDVSCFVRGTWNGGAEDDPAIPPEDWYRVSVFCASPPFPDRRNSAQPADFHMRAGSTIVAVMPGAKDETCCNLPPTSCD